ncbi:AAA family ATPase [Undibacterium sp. RuTC16W]|uniref:AAA family ATPase n=1 Tax=Undibacterium sp. RuTC16W TaxID=3413048 RepID=UPI003BF3B7FD
MHDFPRTPQIYFARSKNSNSRLNPGSILISPVDNSWNDFGYQTLFEYTLFITNEKSISNEFRLAFPGEAELSQNKIVQDIFNQQSSEILAVDNFPQFFTLQLNIEKYDFLVEEFGLLLASDILLSMNDLVIVEREKVLPVWLDSALNSGAFNMSFLRSAEGFIAYSYGFQSFSVSNRKEPSYAPSELKFSFDLPGFKNSHDFNFFFTNDGLLPKRIAVIIGKNGVGKSRTLHELTKSILSHNEKSASTEITNTIIRTLIAVCTPGETEATFPPIQNGNELVNYIRLSALPGERAGGDREPLSVVLQKLSRRAEFEPGRLRWDIFYRAISNLLPFDELVVTPSNIDSAGLNNIEVGDVTLKELNSRGEKIRLEAAKRLDKSGILMRNVNTQKMPLSSGQLSFFRLAAQLCLHIGPGSVVLIDEPETHLHPNLVSDFIVMLNRILEVTHSVAIIATHSAYLVREVPNTQVHHISVDDEGYVFVDRPRLKTFGADVGAISNFIFEDGFVNRFSEQVLEKIRSTSEFSSSWEGELAEELSTEALMYFKRLLSTKKGS